MPNLSQVWRKLSQVVILGLGLSCVLFQAPGYADTVFDAAGLGQNLPNVNTQATGSVTSACSYAATDTYMGPNSFSGYGSGPNSTETIGSGQNGMGPGYISMPAPPLTDVNNNLTLSFRGGSWSSTSWITATWSSGTPSPLSTPVPCTGTYQVFFTLQLQPTFYGGNQNPPQAAPTLTIYPCVQTTDAIPTLVYGSLLAGGACPSTGPFFTFNPVCNGGNYCSVMTFPFATQVHLNAGQIVGPPSIHASAQVAVTGGEFSVYYVGP